MDVSRRAFTKAALAGFVLAAAGCAGRGPGSSISSPTSAGTGSRVENPSHSPTVEQPSQSSATPRPCPPDPRRPKRQFRGLWIASVLNTDWPSRPGLPAAQQQQELIDLLDMARSYRMNAVVLQVRPTADAFFSSDLEPWSRYLTGAQGGYPGYDPLAFACTQAHARGLELHAWFNPYRIAMSGTEFASLTPQHPAVQHPEWCFSYGSKYYYNPGIPEVRSLVEACIMQAVRNYDIDAVHLDDYFYPYPDSGVPLPDEQTYAQYGAGQDLASWRRANVTALIRELAAQIRAVRPTCKLGVSPFGVWRNVSDDPVGSDTRASSPTYDAVYADTRLWARSEWIDYIAPQIYWARSFAPADYDVLVDWWHRTLAEVRTQLIIGEAVYKVGASTQSPEWNNLPQELSDHLASDVAVGGVAGNIWYNASAVRANKLNAMGLVSQDWYSRPALIPTMRWLTDQPAPSAPLVDGHRGGDGLALTLRPEDNRTWQYAVYRLPAQTGPGDAGDCALEDVSQLVGLVVSDGTTQTWIDSGAPADGPISYLVTAIDRSWQESAPATVRVG